MIAYKLIASPSGSLFATLFYPDSWTSTLYSTLACKQDPELHEILYPGDWLTTNPKWTIQLLLEMSLTDWCLHGDKPHQLCDYSPLNYSRMEHGLNMAHIISVASTWNSFFFENALYIHQKCVLSCLYTVGFIQLPF